MKRRSFIASAGALTAGFAGCLQDGGTDDGGSTPSQTTSKTSTATASEETATPDPAANDGYPDTSVGEETPEEGGPDPSSFETLSVGGVQVPLVPIDVARYWYQWREARFVDARGEGQYDDSHVTGAVLSPARSPEYWSQPRVDATADWPEGDRIVCYCKCPHHLSSQRAGEFLDDGYERVYAIDEGFGAWQDQGYPTTGKASSQESYVVRGRTDPTDAGDYAWATQEASDQQEAAPIGDDGSYEMTLHFSGMDASTPLDIRTPSYELTAPLSKLTETVVTEST